MKKYDYLICKQDFKIFKKGRRYQISDIIYVFAPWLVIEIEHDTIFSSASTGYLCYIFDYFYSPQEERKLKINNLKKYNHENI